MRRLRLKYGYKEIEIAATKEKEPTVLDSPAQKSPLEAAAIIKNALENPIDSPRLRDVFSSGERAAIIASDATRPTGSNTFLSIIVDELNAAGISDEDINIIIALGIHRRQTKEEHRRLVGDELYDRIRVSDHDAFDENALVSYGKTSRGTEVLINQKAAEADRIIFTGAVSPHYFAGFGGGRKSIMPGISSADAALRSHLLVFNPSPAKGRNPNVRTAHLAGNPVHEDMLEAARIVNPVFVLNTIVTPEKEILAACAGNPTTAHEAACAAYIKSFGVSVDEPADLTIVSGGGYPKDVNFIQAHKAIHAAYMVTKPGGWMIVLAECADGFGYPEFIDWFRFDNVTEFEKALRADYHIYGQTAYATFEKSTTTNIILVSELPASDVERMKIKPAASFEEAYDIANENMRSDFKTHVIPAASSAFILTTEEHATALASISGEYHIEQREVSLDRS